MPDSLPPDDAPQGRRDERELAAALRSVNRVREEHGEAPLPEPPGSRSGFVGTRALVVATVLCLGVLGLQELAGAGDDTAEDFYSQPPQFTPGEGSYSFLRTHPTTGEPLGFDPCRPIRYQVNPDGAPSDWKELVTDGVSHIEWATGLDFVDAGTTTTPPFDPNRIDRALGEQPVVIGFATEAEVPGLAGTIVGLGGGVPGNVTTTHAYFGTGAIVLDSDYFDRPSSGARRAAYQAVVDHELAHVVGLGHVQDRDEIMNEIGGDAVHFGPGDLEGLARLGRIPCQ